MPRNFEILESGIGRAAADAGHRIKLDRDENNGCRWSCLCGVGGTRSKARDRRADAELHCYVVSGLTPPNRPESYFPAGRYRQHDHLQADPAPRDDEIRHAVAEGTANRAIALVDRWLGR